MEIIHIQTVYVEKLVEIPSERKPIDMPKSGFMQESVDKGYDHLGITGQAEASRMEEEKHERPDFGGRPWYRGYGVDSSGGEAGGAEGGAQNGGGVSRRRWEKYYQGRGDNHDREK